MVKVDQAKHPSCSVSTINPSPRWFTRKEKPIESKGSEDEAEEGGQHQGANSNSS